MKTTFAIIGVAALCLQMTTALVRAKMNDDEKAAAEARKGNRGDRGTRAHGLHDARLGRADRPAWRQAVTRRLVHDFGITDPAFR